VNQLLNKSNTPAAVLMMNFLYAKRFSLNWISSLKSFQSLTRRQMMIENTYLAKGPLPSI
jgi:hypothetical protein